MKKQKVLQINSIIKSGSTGRIVEDISKAIISRGWDSWIAYGRGVDTDSTAALIRIGSQKDLILHGLATRLFDYHGLMSKVATQKLINQIIEINPTIIHLHNIHGYYLNYELLFSFLREYGRPIVWTLHDCWAFTGHCSHYTSVKCNKWTLSCGKCPLSHAYPQSWLYDGSKRNYIKKKHLFTGFNNLHIVTVSDWLKKQVDQSFLKANDIRVIHNGVDCKIFKPTNKQSPLHNKFSILGVASNHWHDKGLNDFISLRERLPENFQLTMVGLSKNQIKKLPSGIVGIHRTESDLTLAKLYSEADIYVNTSKEETLGMTTIESMSCGTPAIVYDSTACAEPIEPNICKKIEVGNIEGIISAIHSIIKLLNPTYTDILREWVIKHFSTEQMTAKYIELYNSF